MRNAKPITVGLELEMTKLSVAAATIFEQRGFGRRSDRSILDKSGNHLPMSGPGAGVELVTPILTVDTSLSPDGDSDEFDFSGIRPVIKDLCSCAASVNSSCGVHVHVGRPNGETTEWNPRRIPNQPGGPMSEWKPGHIRTMLLIGLGLENNVFSIVPESRRQRHHCRRIREIYDSASIQAYYPINNLRPRKHENPQRYCWLNLIETRRPSDPEENRVGYARSKAFGTFEIRALGETSNYEYIEAWVEMWVKIAAAVAYLPAESAALRCLYSGWLQPDIDNLMRLKDKHERTDAVTNRSVLPNILPMAATVTNGNGENE